MAEFSTAAIRIIGVGNLLHGDEGAGVEAAARLAPLVAHRPDIDVVDGGVGGFDLVDFLRGAERIIFFDAVDFGLTPGTLVEFTADDLGVDGGPVDRRSLHEFAVPELLALAEAEGIELPEVEFYGIQVEDLDPGIGLSPRVEEAVEDLVQRMISEFNI